MKIRYEDLFFLRVGSRFLGSGGGGQSLHSHFLISEQLKKREATISQIDEVPPDGLIMSITPLGCPTIETEKCANRLEFKILMEKIGAYTKKSISAIVPLGVGGEIPLFSVFLSSSFNLPILDADCAGRCFPELQMVSTNAAGIRPQRAFISNVMGDVFEIECNNFYTLERHVRQVAVSSGGCCLVVPQILTGEEAKRGLIPGTVTKALTIGKIIQETRDLNAVMEYTKGIFHGVGGIIAATGLNMPHPFKRLIVLRNLEEKKTWEVWMDNEFNLLLENGEVIAEVPDIITLCDPISCEPLTLRELRVCANAAICTMKAPGIWYTEKGLALVRKQDHTDTTNIILNSPSRLDMIA